MKKKGFTLVELLAVIAILAILVIVAMPNVLGMFNQAKSSTFTTEVQTLMDTATTDFMRLALTNQGQDIVFETGGANELDMDGKTKNYYVEMDRNGKFKRVIVFDENFCYDTAKSSIGSGTTIEKYLVNVSDVYLHETDDSLSGGCKALTKAQSN